MISPSSIIPESEAGLTSEPLRALRRGLARAEGFALFVAVVKNPAQRNQLISLLQEAIPGARLQTVSLRADTTDILDEVQNQLSLANAGPIMIVGLEEAISTETAAHPILAALNLRRTDWPKLIHQPVVLWVPEYLLGTLGRVAPDFLDWRSDTLHFPDTEPERLQELCSAIWAGGSDSGMPVAARNERVIELQSRIATNEHSNDPIVLVAVADWLNELGLHLNLLGRMTEARDCFQRALSIFKGTGDLRAESVALSNLGNAIRQMGDLTGAKLFLEQALEIARKTGNRLIEAGNLGNLGIVCRNQGDAKTAIHYFGLELEIAKAVGNLRSEGHGMEGLALAYSDIGDTQKSIELHNQALVIYREIGDRRNEGAVLGNLGVNYKRLGDYQKAINLYEQQLTITREIGDRHGEAAAFGHLSNVYGITGDLRRSIELSNQQLAISKSIGDRIGEGNALINLGNAYNLLGDTAKSFALVEQALIITREVGDLRGEAYSLWNSAVLLAAFNDQVQAVARAAASLKLFELLHDPLAVTVRSKLAEWQGIKLASSATSEILLK